MGDNMELYNNIRELRLQKGWSQEELAKRTGYTDRSSIAKIEAGQVDLTQSKIDLFAKVFNVSPVDLMGFDDDDEIKTEIVKIYEQLSPEQQESVIQLLRSFVVKK